MKFARGFSLLSAMLVAISAEASWLRVNNLSRYNGGVVEGYEFVVAETRICEAYLLRSGNAVVNTHSIYHFSDGRISDLLVVSHFVKHRSKEVEASARRIIFPENHRKAILKSADIEREEEYESVNSVMGHECWRLAKTLPASPLKVLLHPLILPD